MGTDFSKTHGDGAQDIFVYVNPGTIPGFRLQLRGLLIP